MTPGTTKQDISASQSPGASALDNWAKLRADFLAADAASDAASDALNEAARDAENRVALEAAERAAVAVWLTARTALESTPAPTIAALADKIAIFFRFDILGDPVAAAATGDNDERRAALLYLDALRLSEGGPVLAAPNFPLYGREAVRAAFEAARLQARAWAASHIAEYEALGGVLLLVDHNGECGLCDRYPENRTGRAMEMVAERNAEPWCTPAIIAELARLGRTGQMAVSAPSSDAGSSA